MTYQKDTANSLSDDHHPSRKWWTLGLGAIVLSSLLISGCSGGGETSNTQTTTNEQSGELALALTDAEGDFLTYVVDVGSIELTRQDGAVVETLAINTRVDFAQYVDVSELLTLATIPEGLYTTITLNLDYSEANVTVQADNGDPLQATLVDSDGEELEQLSVSLELSDGSRFNITPGVPSHVTLDLDLDASHQIDIIDNKATVIVEPIFLADTQFENPKTLRLRGLLDTVAVDDEVFVLTVRPFRHRQGNFGSIRVHVNDETLYEINGTVFDAQTGLAQLATLEQSTPLISLGTWDRETAQYIAKTVFAGSSVPWGDVDALRGVVIDRVDNTLTIRGAVIELADGNYRFDDDIQLILSEQTTVTQQFQGLSNSDISNISVGSAIRASGELVDNNTLDASAGHVRIHLANLSGRVISVSPLSINLQQLTGRHPTLYNFSGTGSDAASDANPQDYEIDTNSLNLNSINVGDPIKARGLVSAFGTAPEDFIAQTLFDASEIKGHLVINYGKNGAQSAIAQITNEMLVFDLSESPTRHHVKRAAIVTDLSTFESMPKVIPSEQTGIFAITQRGRIEIYHSFTDFVTALNNALAAGKLVTRIDAHGHFDDTQVQLSSKRLRVGLTL